MKKIIIIIIGILAAAGIVIFMNKDKSDFVEYNNHTNDFIEQNKQNSDERAENFMAAGLDVERAYASNMNSLNEAGISFDGLTERDFYYDGYVWSITILSADNIPYYITIDSEYNVHINKVVSDSEESDI